MQLSHNDLSTHKKIPAGSRIPVPEELKKKGRLSHEEVRVAIDRKRDPWLFGLDESDSLQFEKADELIPVGKLFEMQTSYQ